MTCPKCGAESNGKFCSNCGAPLNQAQQEKPDFRYSPKKGSFWGQLKAQMKYEQKQSVDKKQYEKERLAQLNRDHIPYCPFCHSTNIAPVKKGFGIGKALVGGAVVGPVGLLAGGIGANKIKRVCLNCGRKF